MSQIHDEDCSEATLPQQQKQTQKQHSSEVKYNDSEIEKLYLKIKEDWL